MALKQHPSCGRCHRPASWRFADCYTELDFHETARSMYVHLAETADIGSEHLPDVARGLARFGEYQHALSLCREAVMRSPDCDQALYGMAYYMAKCGYPGELVLPVLHRVVEWAPGNVRYRVALATLHQQLGQHEAAKTVLARLTPEQLGSIGCQNCLRQIAKTFAASGDVTRYQSCLARLRELMSRSSQRQTNE